MSEFYDIWKKTHEETIKLIHVNPKANVQIL